MNADNHPPTDLHGWLGREQTRHDRITAAPLQALSATLDRGDPPPQSGTLLPPLAHWLYFLPCERQSELGPDGHARRGGFLPPVALPRRMWAGGRVEFRQPLSVGEDIVRRSRIDDISEKGGRSGPLVFVRVRHEISNAAGVAIVEEHDIVYRDAPVPDAAPAAPRTAPTDEDFARRIEPDPVLLFRYSALTFNGHRIHYDRRYVQEVEGYPGLVVHGPLIATLLVDLLRREFPAASLARFSFKALRPLFDTAAFSVCGRREPDGGVALWARDAEGLLAMQASATLS